MPDLTNDARALLSAARHTEPTEDGLPALPPHPDSHTYAWTETEKRAIRAYARAALAASAPPSRHLTDAQLLRALHSVTPAVSPDLTAERGGVLVPSQTLRDLAAAILRESAAPLEQKPAPKEPVSMPPHWSVDVHSDGETLVSIGNDWLSGRELEEFDERTILGAAQHLLSFIGYGLPPCDFNPDEPAAPLEPAAATIIVAKNRVAQHSAPPAPEPAAAKTRGEVPGHPLPDWPDDLVTYAERSAYQRGIADARRMAAAESCDHCHGSGQRYWHSPDCSDDLCALNGDEHSCAGQLEQCPCVAAPPASVPAGGEWIPVSERLPEPFQPVALIDVGRMENCHFDRHVAASGYWNDGMGGHWCVRGERAQSREAFTHWLALPPAPAGEGERSC